MQFKINQNAVCGLDTGIKSCAIATIVQENNGLTLGYLDGLILDTVSDSAIISKSKSPTAIRRKFRQARRQKDRKKARQKKIRHWIKEKFGLSDVQYHNNTQDIFLLLANAIHQQLTLNELALVLYYIASRRGFQSTSRAHLRRIIKQSQEDQDHLETQQVYQNQDVHNDDTKKSTAKSAKECVYLERVYAFETEVLNSGMTYGEYIYKNFISKNLRFRGIHITRKLVLNQFNRIWAEQSKYYSVFNTANKESFLNIMLFTRRLKPCDHLREKCQLEPQKPRCLKANNYYAEFAIWSAVNNLRIEQLNKPSSCLSLQQKQYIANQLLKCKSLKLNTVRNRKKLCLSETVSFNIDSFKNPAHKGRGLLNHLTLKHELS